jgi:hypothetical protein
MIEEEEHGPNPIHVPRQTKQIRYDLNPICIEPVDDAIRV